MKILFSTTVPETFFFFFGPLIARLKLKKIDFTLITSGRTWIAPKDVEEKYGIGVRTVPLSRSLFSFGDILGLFSLIRILRKEKPSILHATTPKAAFVSLIAGWMTRVPFRIYSARGLIALGKLPLQRFILHCMERIACGLAHKVIVNSHSNLRYFQENRLCRGGKIGILANGSGQGVDAKDKFNPDHVNPKDMGMLRESLGIKDNAVVFGFVGRLVRDKGVEDLAAAWNLFVQERPDAVLLIVGPENEPRDKVSKKTLTILKETPSIKYAGHVKDPVPYYAAMDALVLPSYREGFPNAVLEAYAMSKPVITTSAPGCIDAVRDGETGFMIAAGDRTALQDSMKRLHDNPGLRKKMGEKGRAWVLEKFRPELIVDDLMYIYMNRSFNEL